MKICKIRPDCWICTVGLFRKTMAFLVNRNSKDLMQVRADLIYDIKNVEDNYFDKNRTEN